MKQINAITVAIGMIVSVSSVQATEDFCAVVLKTPDGFLALRDGPGTQFKTKTKLYQSDFLNASTGSCTRNGFCDQGMKWTHILSIPRIDGPFDKAKHFTEGWVSRKFIQEFACPEDQETEATNK